MADFDIPNNTKIDGVYPSEVNFPEPGKRPISSMSAAILTDNNGDVQHVKVSSTLKHPPRVDRR